MKRELERQYKIYVYMNRDIYCYNIFVVKLIRKHGNTDLIKP